MEDQTFTFSWEVKNFSLCTKRRFFSVRSEKFVAWNMYNTEWIAYLSPRSEDDPNFISLVLKRCDKRFFSTGLQVTFGIVAADGSPGNEITKTMNNSKCTTFGHLKYAKRSDLERLYLHKDTLKIQCVFRKINKDLNTERLFARSADDADVQTIYKVFALTNFSHVKQGILLYESIRLQEGSEILFDVLLSIDGGPGRQVLKIQFNRRYYHSWKQFSVNTLIVVLNAQGKKSQIWEQDQHVFDMRTLGEVWQFPTFIKVAHLMRQKNNYLVKDVLNLKCEITISYEIMKSQVGLTSFTVEIEDKNSVDKLTEHMKDLYNSKRFADVNLRVSGETVPAHRIVLQSRSKKFAEMLDVDVLTDNNVLDVPDLDMITLKRMLKYMYTDEIDNLEYEDAVVAYITAHKYRIVTLKCKYSFVLLSHLKVSNVCTILMHADDFCDHVLKNFAVDFIEQYWHCVGLSEDWEELSKERPLLAQKTKEQLSRTYVVKHCPMYS